MRKNRGRASKRKRRAAGKGRMQCAAFLLILVFCLAADGIADTYGPTAFAAVGAAVLGTAAVLILLSAEP